MTRSCTDRVMTADPSRSRRTGRSGSAGMPEGRARNRPRSDRIAPDVDGTPIGGEGRPLGDSLMRRQPDRAGRRIRRYERQGTVGLSRLAERRHCDNDDRQKSESDP